MPAIKTYTFNYIERGATASVFIHGYSDNTAVTYSAVGNGLYTEGVSVIPAFDINLTQGEVYRHVDGTIARKVHVQNRAPNNPCRVDIYELYDLV